MERRGGAMGSRGIDAEEDEEYRFALSPDEYLERYGVNTYLQDALLQMLRMRSESTKESTALEFLAAYFSSVVWNENVLFREHTYINATARNRRAFVKMVWKCFKHLARSGEVYTVAEFHNLVTLLCKDFPADVVADAVRAVLVEDSRELKLSFTDFVYSFQIHFYFREFLQVARIVFNSLKATSDDGKVSSASFTKQLQASRADLLTAPKHDAIATALADAPAFEDFGDIVELFTKSDAFVQLVDALPRRGQMDAEEEEDEIGQEIDLAHLTLKKEKKKKRPSKS